MFNCNNVKFLFKIGCMIFTIILVTQWMERYFLDEDMTIIENRSYYMDDSDLFPVMSLCFKQVFHDKLFEKFGPNITGSKYEEYLKGEFFDEIMNTIDYDSVTTNISDYVIAMDAYFQNGTSVEDTLSNVAWKPPYHSYSWQSWKDHVKCFSFELTDKNIHIVRIFILRDIFPNRIRPQYAGFTVMFHYPNQLSTSIHSITRQWVSRNELSNYWMDFNIRGMNVVVRRYKKKYNNCLQNWQNYDNVVIEQLIKSVGCKAPYQKTKDYWPICKSKQKMKKVQFPIETVSGFNRPCREIENINYQTLDSETESEERHVVKLQGKEWTKWFCVVWRYLNFRFIKTIAKKEIDIQSLVGYVGGYIGMFTGLALAQIPELLTTTFFFGKRLLKWFNTLISNKTAPNSLTSE